MASIKKIQHLSWLGLHRGEPAVQRLSSVVQRYSKILAVTVWNVITGWKQFWHDGW